MPRIVKLLVLCVASLSLVVGLTPTGAGAAPPGGGAAAPTGHSQPPPNAELVPAFTHDQPTGSIALRAAATTQPRPAFSGPDWICTVYASDPWKTLQSGRQSIKGEGWQSCSGTHYPETAIWITVQQYRGLGIWANKYQWKSGWGNSGWLDGFAWWYCASGTGNQLYRIITNGFAEGGLYEGTVQSQNYLRVTCP